MNTAQYVRNMQRKAIRKHQTVGDFVKVDTSIGSPLSTGLITVKELSNIKNRCIEEEVQNEQLNSITKNWQMGSFGEMGEIVNFSDPLYTGTADVNPASTKFSMSGMGATTPAVSTAEKIVYWPTVAQYAPIIEKYAKQFNIPPNILGNIIYKESSGRANAFNEDNGNRSRGLMQITESTAKSLGFKEADFDKLYDPDTNIYYGTKLLSQYRDMEWPLFSKDTTEQDKWTTVASAYNQGPGYGVNALKKLTEMGKPTTWPNVLWYMTNHSAPNGKRPFTAYAEMYGPFITGNFDWTTMAKNVGIGLGTTVILGIIGYFAYTYFTTTDSETVKKDFGLALNPCKR